MSLMGMKAESMGINLTSDRPPFINWKKNSRLRVFGSVERRYQHFVVVKQDDGNEKITAINCSNYDYDKIDLAETTKRDERDCILCEIYSDQIGGRKHPELDFVSFAPNRWDADKPPVLKSFQANMLCFDREVQEVDLAGSLSIISFRMSNWNEIMGWIPPNMEEAKTGFYRGDPTEPTEGYDIKITYFPDKKGAEMYNLDYQLTNSPLTEEELQAIEDRKETFLLSEYYKKKTRDEQIQHLYDVHDVQGRSSFNPWEDNKKESSSTEETDEVAGEIAKLMQNS